MPYFNMEIIKKNGQRSWHWTTAQDELSARNYAIENWGEPTQVIPRTRGEVAKELTDKGWKVRSSIGTAIQFERKEEFSAVAFILLLIFTLGTFAIIYLITWACSSPELMTIDFGEDVQSLVPGVVKVEVASRQVQPAIQRSFQQQSAQKENEGLKEIVARFSLFLNFILAGLMIFYLVYPSLVLKHRYQAIQLFQNIFHKR